MSGEQAFNAADGAGAPDGAGPDTPEVLFDAVITPYRSLSPQGFMILMIAVGGLGFCSGVMFFLIGAWPVFGFTGLDVLMVYLAFRVNYRSGRAVEYVRLTRSEIHVRRIDHRGRVSEYRMPSYWLRVELTGDEDRADIWLRSHGRSRPVATWLSPGERLDFASALRSAIDITRRPPHLA